MGKIALAFGCGTDGCPSTHLTEVEAAACGRFSGSAAPEATKAVCDFCDSEVGDCICARTRVIGLDTIAAAMSQVCKLPSRVEVYGVAAVVSEFVPAGTLVMVTPCACPAAERLAPNHLARHVAIFSVPEEGAE